MLFKRTSLISQQIAVFPTYVKCVCSESADTKKRLNPYFAPGGVAERAETNYLSSGLTSSDTQIVASLHGGVWVNCVP